MKAISHRFPLALEQLFNHKYDDRHCADSEFKTHKFALEMIEIMTSTGQDKNVFAMQIQTEHLNWMKPTTPKAVT